MISIEKLQKNSLAGRCLIVSLLLFISLFVFLSSITVRENQSIIKSVKYPIRISFELGEKKNVLINKVLFFSSLRFKKAS